MLPSLVPPYIVVIIGLLLSIDRLTEGSLAKGAAPSGLARATAGKRRMSIFAEFNITINRHLDGHAWVRNAVPYGRPACHPSPFLRS